MWRSSAPIPRPAHVKGACAECEPGYADAARVHARCLRSFVACAVPRLSCSRVVDWGQSIQIQVSKAVE